MTHQLFLDPETGRRIVLTKQGVENLSKYDKPTYARYKYIGPCDEKGDTGTAPITEQAVIPGVEETMAAIFNDKTPPAGTVTHTPPTDDEEDIPRIDPEVLHTPVAPVTEEPAAQNGTTNADPAGSNQTTNEPVAPVTEEPAAQNGTTNGQEKSAGAKTKRKAGEAGNQ
jgi:hypothetical protein